MRYERTLLAVLFVLPRALLGADATEQGAPEPVQAIWKNQEFAFYFQSQTTFYSCSSLEAKLERILKVLGVQTPYVRVRAVDCQGGPVRMPRVLVNITAPVLATPEAIAERDKGKSKLELTARVRGQKVDPEALAPFPAQWKRVSLSRGAVDLEPGDCELIDELRRKVERDKGMSKLELTSKVRGQKIDPEALAPFPAQWKRVSLSRGAVDLEPETAPAPRD